MRDFSKGNLQLDDSEPRRYFLQQRVLASFASRVLRRRSPPRSNGAHPFAPNTPDDVPANFDEVARAIPADRNSPKAVRGSYKVSLIEPSRGKLARVDFIRNFPRASRVAATLFPSLVC